MSKKKERRIKRLQRLPIWTVVVQMILTELIIFSFTVFICVISVFGIINSLILNNAKDCKTVLEYVNENWEKESREELNQQLNTFETVSNGIDSIYIDDKNDIISLFPELRKLFDVESQRLFNDIGMIHFLDPENNSFSFDVLISGEEMPSHTNFIGTNIKQILYNPRNFFKSLKITRLLRDREFLTWANTESIGLHSISFVKTSIPNVNLCFKMVYRLNAFQFNLLCTVLLFSVIIIIFSCVYEITKVISHIHERVRVNKLVTTDTVTGGYNKDYFIQKSRKEIARGRRKYVVVQLRLEKYRNYCTAYGLKQGENLLEELNSDIVSMLDKKEFVAHVERSDFALLLIYQNEDALFIRIKNIMNILREKRNTQRLSFSAGICPVTSHSDDISLVLICAGLAVPKSIKIQDEIVWFDDSMKEEQVWERRIEDDMEKALENHEFKVFLQPKYSTKGEKLSAAEALVRWQHPVLGFISPAKFIPLFERNGFILQLDDYMLTEVVQLQAMWESQGKKIVPISVNISRAHFAEENLAEHICEIVDRYKIPHEYIELELTESAFFDDKAVLLETVNKLKSFGFKVSMDDFGAGYSSLNSLKELPLDIIKIDAEFFRSVDDIERSNLIVGETITLAKKLGMQIVAEGIETREQVDFLAKKDCDLIQGFYFSKPLPVEEFEKKAYKNA